MEYNKKNLFYKSFKAILYGSAVTLLILQIQGVVETFIEAQTAYSIAKVATKSLSLPTIIICPKIKNLGTASVGNDIENFLKQFHWLGQQFNISVLWFPAKQGSTDKMFENLILGAQSSYI